MSRPLVRFNGVDIIFGNDPKSALPLVDRGMSREDIQNETGQVLGVAGASLDIEKGEIIVLMGLSGSGKSTLLRAVNGLNPVIRGEALVDNGENYIDPQHCSAADLRRLRMELVTMVFQQFGLLPWRTVADNVGFGLELAGVSASKRNETVAEQLKLVGLDQWSDRRVNELSGGMQQRVGLARAFATGAPILLMDEPFSALDPLIRTRLQDELLQLQQQLHKTIIFVSHDLDEAFRIGNRIAIMEGGRIVQCGTPQQIVQNPASAYVADFVANMNPLSMLVARDVMTAAAESEDMASSGLSATAAPDAPLTDILDSIAKRPGAIGIIDNGAVVGTITAQDIVKGLTRHRQTAGQ
ncbi:MAG: choline ABC transporter ATP-binding protein [Pseudomonadota bacterium]